MSDLNRPGNEDGIRGDTDEPPVDADPDGEPEGPSMPVVPPPPD